MPTVRISLPAVSTSVPRARRLLRDVLGAEHVRIDDAELLTSEVVTNAIEHARSAFELRISLGPPVRVEVQDGRPPTGIVQRRLDEPPAVPASVPRGRGLLLVHTLASRHGVDDAGTGGKVVWFEL